ncbi:hypothetical protein Enr10x_06690 [Gimesia panareensis]|uniref:Uncharacterized protein n=1 Tax=Gimesia panareensis TaxID=2527978 RepID=A0A517Q158_9PLAN|nr:hypothetical protein Enr10x_06690 [Gimesia panareensis]
MQSDIAAGNRRSQFNPTIQNQRTDPKIQGADPCVRPPCATARLTRQCISDQQLKLKRVVPNVGAFERFFDHRWASQRCHPTHKPEKPLWGVVSDAIRYCRRQQEVAAQPYNPEPAHQPKNVACGPMCPPAVCHCSACPTVHIRSTHTQMGRPELPGHLRDFSLTVGQANGATRRINLKNRYGGWYRMQSDIAAGNRKSQLNPTIQNQRTDPKI